MKLRRVLSYRNAWEQINSTKPRELQEVLEAFSKKKFPSREENQRPSMTWIDEMLSPYGWEDFREHMENIGRYARLGVGLGHYKNGVTCRLLINPFTAHQVIFSATQIAVKNGLTDIPVLICYKNATAENLHTETFDKVLKDLKANEPLVLKYPFLILEIGAEDGPVKHLNLLSEEDLTNDEVALSRCIEFPPEHYQAGVGILSYFGQILKARFPEKNTQFSIQQEHNLVRMVVISEKGDKEIIEQTFEEYKMVVVGERAPDSIALSREEVLKLKLELRTAQTKIEGMQDILEYQKDDIKDLRSLLHASSNRGNTINFAPVIEVHTNKINSNINVHVNDLSKALEDIIPLVPPAQQNRVASLSAVTEGLSDLTKEELKENESFSEVGKFVKEVSKKGATLNDILTKTSDGLEAIEKLTAKYNLVAKAIGIPLLNLLF